MLPQAYASHWKPQDFPAHFLNYQHPDDYLYTDEPIEPQFVTVQCGSMYRYFFRLSWRCEENLYVSMSFLVDSGTAGDFMLSKKAYDILQKHKMISHDNKVELFKEDEGALYHASICKTSLNKEPVNFIGLSFIHKMGFVVQPTGYRFERAFEYF